MAECIYCGKEASSRDHVPPKSLFPKPRPVDLITVPCCEDCNSSASKDEEYFLAVYMFSDAGITDSGKRLWQQKLRRMYKKNVGLRHLLSASIVKVRIWTPSGIFLETRKGIKIDHHRLNAVVKKVVRGLYFHEFKEKLPNDTWVDTLVLDDQKKTNNVAQFASQVLAGSRDWSGVFEYRRNRVPDKPQGSMWFLRFYGRITYWALTASPDTRENLRTK